jgi:hypothetical protein
VGAGPLLPLLVDAGDVSWDGGAAGTGSREYTRGARFASRRVLGPDVRALVVSIFVTIAWDVMCHGVVPNGYIYSFTLEC